MSRLLKTLVTSSALAFGLALTSFIGAARADTWPTRPVRLIVPYPGGGGVDVLARALAAGLQDKWKQPVVIDLRPGANTLVGTDAVAKATDGLTLLFTTDATFTINPHLYKKLPYDPIKDFSPITQVAAFSQLLITKNDFPVNTLPELVALAKSKPGTLSYASYGPGSQPHLAMEMFKNAAGIDIVHVPYKGVPQALNAVLAGEVPLTWSGVASSQVHLKAHTIKALAYAGKTRASAFPDVPTFAELGYPAVDANVWMGVFAPSSMPAERVQQINADIQTILANPEFQATQIASRGYDKVNLGPQEFAQAIKTELQSRAEAVKLSGATAD